MTCLVHKLYYQKSDDSTLAFQILDKIGYILRYSEMEIRIGFSLMVKNSEDDLRFLYAAKGLDLRHLFVPVMISSKDIICFFFLTNGKIQVQPKPFIEQN